MNGQVQRVITPQAVAAQRVVDGQGKIDEGTPLNSGCAYAWWRQCLPDRPEMVDRRVILDRIEIIKDERTRETVVIGQQPRRDHHQRDEFPLIHEAKRLSNVAI